MKKSRLLVTLIATIGLFSILPSFSQDETGSGFTTGADFYSSYIWRGTKYGTGPAFQPSVKYTGRIFTAGGWGSVDFSRYQEADLYFSFSLPAGISLGMTDYYYPGLRYFDYSANSGSHAFDINVGLAIKNFSFSANYIVNKANGAGSAGGDKYFQAGYSFKSVSLFVGAGDGWYTQNTLSGDDRFNVCNIGMSTTKTIRITDSFNIPVTGQVILNPDKQQLFIVVGFTLGA